MTNFRPRLTVPSNDDPNYTRPAYGGRNNCIPGSPEAWPGSVLANCVGEVHGRWWEILGHDPGLCPYDAKYFWTYNDGYNRGSEPKLGAIICFDATRGHVAVVERIIDADTIVTSNSAYQQTIWYTQTLRRANNWTWNSAFTFQGFIYLPGYVLTEQMLAAFAIRRKKGKRATRV